MGHCHKRETDVSDFSECEVTNFPLRFKTFFPIFYCILYFLGLYRGAQKHKTTQNLRRNKQKSCVSEVFFIMPA